MNAILQYLEFESASSNDLLCFQVRIQQLGPGMVSQVQTMCGECRGQGERINAKDRCKTCEGRKVGHCSLLLYFLLLCTKIIMNILVLCFHGMEGPRAVDGK